MSSNSRLPACSASLATITLALVLAQTAFAQRAPESQAPQPNVDSAKIVSGRQVFLSNCAFCHGANARGGGQGGPDLTQSALIRGDENGKEVANFLKGGRPEKGMPAFHLSEDSVDALFAFLKSVINASASQHNFGTEVLVGDAAAGRAFFHGEGNCKQCHSETGDLKGIGSKYQPAVLQGRLVLPVGNGGYPGFAPSEPPRIHVTVTTASGKTISGLLAFLSDYAVTVVTPTGERQTFPRSGDAPQIVTKDPLQAHFDLLPKLTDKQMHDLTAYLATLK